MEGKILADIREEPFWASWPHFISNFCSLFALCNAAYPPGNPDNIPPYTESFDLYLQMNNGYFQVLMNVQATAWSPRMEDVKSFLKLARYVLSADGFWSPQEGSCIIALKKKD